MAKLGKRPLRRRWRTRRPWPTGGRKAPTRSCRKREGQQDRTRNASKKDESHPNTMSPGGLRVCARLHKFVQDDFGAWRRETVAEICLVMWRSRSRSSWHYPLWVEDVVAFALIEGHRDRRSY